MFEINKKRKAFAFRELNLKDVGVYACAATEKNMDTFLLSTFEVKTPEDAVHKLRPNGYNKKFGLIYFPENGQAEIMAVFHVESNQNQGAIVQYFVVQKFRGRKYSVAGITLLGWMLKKQYKYFDFEVHNLSSGANVTVQETLGSEKLTVACGCTIYRYDFQKLPNKEAIPKDFREL